MQILYTGATKQGVEQLHPDLSLGGLVSGSVIPNDILSNIFSPASILSIQNKRRETKMIALKNNNNDIVTDISLKFSLDIDSICNYKVAFVLPTINIDHSCFEKITNTHALPYYATFQPILNNSTFNIALINKDAYLGVWLIREYNYNSIDLKSKKCEDWTTILEAGNLPPNQIEKFSFLLDYTIGEPSVSSSTSVSSHITM